MTFDSFTGVSDNAFINICYDGAYSPAVAFDLWTKETKTKSME